MDAVQKKIAVALQALVLVCALVLELPCQQIPSPNSKSKGEGVARQLENPSDVSLAGVPGNIFLDQKEFITSPIHMRQKDLNWILPLAFGTAFTFGIDHAVERNLPSSSSTIRHATSLSNYAAFGMAGAVAGTYFWGLHTHNDRLHRTGLLAGEAALDSILDTSLIKAVTWRERPQDASGHGNFYKSSSALGSSFPSQHAAFSWAIASVLASEYPGPLTKLFAYGGASAISISRVVGRDHFPSDVLIGSALGFYLGRQVFRSRSVDAPEASIGEFIAEPKVRSPKGMASPFVPLDSWIYPAMSRLEARGFLPSAMMGMRPWTRLECARLLEQAQHSPLFEDGADRDDSALLAALTSEFRYEAGLLNGERNTHAMLDSVYTRSLGVSGSPIADPLHSGQTLVNDFGRPFTEGFNQLAGLSADAEAGPLAVYVRGEYQYAPSSDPVSLSARTSIAEADRLPLMPGAPVSAVSRFRLLDSYVALNLKDWQFSFGKQSLWWGPDAGGDLMLSNNAEPVWMLRLSRVSPFRLPMPLSFMGPVRTEMFVGQLQGYHFLRLGPTFNLVGSWNSYVNPQPYLWGGKISFKPTQNLELGFSMTTVFAGLGRPMTLETFKHTFSSSGNAQTIEPGDRRTGFDFSYRLPGLRRWVKLYNGSMAEDEPNPIGYPRRSAMNPGIYLVRIPKFEKLDFRAEGVYTNLPGLTYRGYFYTNGHYAAGYTNYGGLLGSWVGPQGSGVQLWSTYWFDAQKKLQLGWREQTVDPSYIQGGHLHDYSAEYSFRTHRDVLAKVWFQFEHLQFPAIGPERNNAALAFSFEYRPKWGRALTH